ncbi:MAG: hypothetical protein ACLSGX_08345 [Pseudoruminococcus massiliensis]|uniref:hypothetical protein n=1 Tax=Pseudoruminococcus massiliensis TaxID=2086583 RepID=UPI003991A304|nr:hypothetical protein [Oscillospiraceae bacterium]
MKMNLFSNIFSKKQNNIFGNIKAKVPKTAQDTIPFIEAYENGLFLTGENTYTLIFAYNNIDYFLFRDDEKEDIYEKYMRLLNTLPSDIEYQEFTMNTEVNSDVLYRTLLPNKDSEEKYPDIAKDYKKVIGSYIENTSSAAAKKIMLIAMTYSISFLAKQILIQISVLWCLILPRWVNKFVQ